MNPLADIILIYTTPDGETFEQPLSDIATSGTLIDPENEDDLELTSWRFAKDDDCVVVELDPAPDAGLTHEVDQDGTVRYRNNDGLLHREDGPAYEWADGSRFWLRHDRLHREDGPAVKWADGTREWWLDGVRHREGGPAIERSGGDREWYLHGEPLSEAEFEARA